MKRGPESKRTLELINLLRKGAVENRASIWRRVAERLSGAARRRAEVNIYNIDKHSKEGDTIVVPGKILSSGEISKKIRIAALAYSKEAEKKLKDKKCEIVSLVEEIKKNPKMQGVKIIK